MRVETGVTFVTGTQEQIQAKLDKLAAQRVAVVQKASKEEDQGKKS